MGNLYRKRRRRIGLITLKRKISTGNWLRKYLTQKQREPCRAVLIFLTWSYRKHRIGFWRMKTSRKCLSLSRQAAENQINRKRQNRPTRLKTIPRKKHKTKSRNKSKSELPQLSKLKLIMLRFQYLLLVKFKKNRRKINMRECLR